MNIQHYFKEVRVLVGKRKSAIYLNGELYLIAKVITTKMWSDMVVNNYIGDVFYQELDDCLISNDFPNNYSNLVK